MCLARLNFRLDGEKKNSQKPLIQSRTRLAPDTFTGLFLCRVDGGGKKTAFLELPQAHNTSKRVMSFVLWKQTKKMKTAQEY